MGKFASHGRIVKVVGPNEKIVAWGNLKLERCKTAYVERLNGSLRLWMKRLNRKTYAFSKKWVNLNTALALQFAHYNLVRVHGSFKETPAVRAGLALAPWSVDDLVTAVAVL